MLRRLFVKIGLDSGDTVERLKGVSKEVDKAKAEFEKFGGKSSAAMADLAKATGHSQKTLQTYVDSSGRLRDTQGRFSKLKESIDSTKQSTDNLKLAFSGLAAVGLGAAMFGIGRSILSVGINFQAQMSQVAAATNASKENLAELTNEARRLGATTTFSATEAAEAMTELGKAGLNTKQIMVGTNSVLQLAGAGQLGLAEATTIASDTMSGFGLQAEDMGRIADVMAKGANASTISVQMLGETFKYVSGVAKTANVSLEETAALTAILGNAGIKGSMAGTTLKAMLIQLASPSKEAAKIMSNLGVRTADAAGNMLPIADIIGDLQKSMNGFGSKKKIDIMSTIFGSEPAAGVLALLDKGKLGIEEMTEVMRKSGGSAAEFAKKANANIKGMLKSLNSIIEEIQLKIFDNLIPLISPVLAFFTDSEKGMARTSFTVGLLATAIGVGLVLAAKSAMVAGYAMLATYLPVIGIIAGITASLAALYLIFEDIWVFLEYGPQGSETFFGDMLKWLGLTDAEMQALSDKFQDFKRIMGEAWDALKEFANSPTGQFLIKMAKWAGIAVAAIIAFPFAVIFAFATMSAYIISKWDQITAFLKKTAILTGKILLVTLFPIAGLYIFRKEIGKVFDWIWDKVKDFPIVQKLVEQFTGLKDRIAGVFSGMWESLKSIFQGVLPVETMNDLIDGLNWISRKLNDFSSSKAVSALGISPLNLPIIPHIEQRALGGPINAGQPYIVGERGPELVVPRDNGNVIPNNQLPSSTAGNSSNTFNFSISIHSASPEYDAYALVQKAMELLNGENEKSKQRFELGLS